MEKGGLNKAVCLAPYLEASTADIGAAMINIPYCIAMQMNICVKESPIVYK